MTNAAKQPSMNKIEVWNVSTIDINSTKEAHLKVHHKYVGTVKDTPKLFVTVDKCYQKKIPVLVCSTQIFFIACVGRWA